MESIKNCNTCFFNTNQDLAVCETCTYESSPEKPYPQWEPVIFEEADGSLTYTVKQPITDNVNHPKHYTIHPSGVECIQITEHMNFCLGNAMKYIWRAGEKHETPLEDLKKAKWYIDREIKRLQNAE